jgi:hypothetical protein
LLLQNQSLTSVLQSPNPSPPTLASPKGYRHENCCHYDYC